MRLTNTQKEQIVTTAIKDQIDPAWGKALERLKSAATEANDQRYSDETKKWMSSAPEGAFVWASSVELSVNGKLFRFPTVRGKTDYRIHIGSFPILYKDIGGVELNLTGNLAKKAIRAAESLEKINDQRKELTTTLNAALAACNTHKQLQENYPCLAKYLPKTATTATALTITNSDVEKLLSKRKAA